MNRPAAAPSRTDAGPAAFDTPILMIVFNRADTARRVFEAVREMRPRTLLVSADGPRSEAEAERCAAARAIVHEVDWECDVRTNFNAHNLGGPRACSGGISWAFDQVERAIVLEDDCLPNRAFFEFCAAMLERYADTPEVMHVCGSNFIAGQQKGEYDYHFSRYASAWGWASWRRAWQHFDLDLARWPQARRDGLLERRFATRFERDYWAYFFDRVHRKVSVHWDYAWKFACLVNEGLAVVPNANLISNIGFDANATHTTNTGAYVARLPLEDLDVARLRHPPAIVADDAADAQTFDCRYRRDRRTRMQKLGGSVKRGLRRHAGTLLERLPAARRRRVVGALKRTVGFARLHVARAVRLVSRPALPRNPGGEVCVHLGCGAIDHPSFINVDLLPFRHIHYIHPIDRLGMFADGSVDLVYACHCLEHFPYAQLGEVLGEWRRVLRPGGVLRLSVPDFDVLLQIYQDNDRDPETIVRALMGGQDYAYNFHYNIFTRRQLSAALQAAGFAEVHGWTPGTSKLTSINDWSGRALSVGGRDYAVSLNLEAVR